VIYLVLVVVVSAGCLDTLGPDVGSPVRSPCSNTDSDPGTAVKFDAEIRIALFARADVHCTRCHTPAGETPLGVQVSGLDLTSLASLRTGGALSGSDIIKPGDPCGSLLIQKLGEAPPFGARMPLDGPPYLDARQIRTIADWIAEGAHAD
jgi:mono/diheme cytochrome c family protein